VTPIPSVVEFPEMLDPPAGSAELALAELTSSTCGKFASNGNGGTAPAPTPTRVPEKANATASSPVEVAEFLLQAHSISDNLSSWSKSFEALWEFDLNPRQQAAALAILEIKTFDLCEAADLLNPPGDLIGTHSLLRETVRSRHAWAVLAMESLIESGTARSEFLNEGQISTKEYIGELRSSLTETGGGITGENILLGLSHFGIGAQLPAGWFVRGTDRNPIIVAPTEYQLGDLAGLGPSGWDNGVSVRIRRFRNSGQITSEEAIERFSGLISSLGVSRSKSTGTLLGVDAVYSIVENSKSSWEFTVAIAVVKGDTFVIDYGCPQVKPEWCGAVQDVVDSFSITAD